MAETMLDEVVDEMRVELRRCPHDLILSELRNTIRDFCQHTRAWQVWTTNGQIITGQSEYAIAVPGSWAQPIAIEFLQLDEEEVPHRTTNWLDANIPDWRFRQTESYFCFTQESADTFRFPCVPQINGLADALKYRASYKPTNTADRVEAKLVTEYLEAFEDGTVARLKAMANEPWTDVGRARLADAEYRDARKRARIRVGRSYGGTVELWGGPRLPKFGGR